MNKNIYILNESSLGHNTGIKSYINQLIFYLANNTKFNIHIINLCLDQKEYTLESSNSIFTHHIPIQWEVLKKRKNRYYQSIFYLLESHIENTLNSIFLINLFIHDEVIRLIKEKYCNIKIFFIVHYLDISFLEKSSYSRENNIGIFNIYPYIERNTFIFNSVDKIICLSKETKKILQKDYQLSKSKISVINNGLKDEFISLSKIEKQSLKEQLSFNKEDQIILYVGRLDPNKGIFELIQAFKQTVKKIPNIRLILVGGGDISLFMNECKEYWSKIIFTGLIDKEYVYKFYQIATIGVLPSYTEQCSYAAIEMMMHGLPLIGTTANGISEMIEENKTGYKIKLYEKDNKQTLNTDELAIRIEELLCNKTKITLFSKQSRIRYIKYYQLNIMGEKMEELIYGK